MIYSLEGILSYTEPGLAVIDCGGVGYAVRVTANTASQLPSVGKTARVFVSMQVREDGVDLYGFYELAEKECFLRLLTVSGVGPKVAIAILSGLTPQQFLHCVAAGDSKTLTVAKGVGSKMAQRIVLELKDKIDSDLFPTVSGAKSIGGNPNLQEAADALAALGYSQLEATQALSGLDEHMSTSDLIKAALRQLSKQ